MSANYFFTPVCPSYYKWPDRNLGIGLGMLLVLGTVLELAKF